jgi:ubiquinone/menaquinone biosynthesis C-methylase UbiE
MRYRTPRNSPFTGGFLHGGFGCFETTTKSLVLGDLRFLPFKKGAFAAAVSMDTSFGYLANEDDDTDALTEAQRVLNQGGKLVLDIFNREHLTRKYSGKPSEPITLEYSNFVMIQKRSISISGDQLCDTWTLKKKSSGERKVFDHTVRLYLYSDLEQMLSTAGFRVDKVLGGYKSQPYSIDSSRLIFVASAR